MAITSKLLNLKTFFLAVLILSSIGLIATDIYLPSLSTIVHDLATTPSVAKLTLSLYLLSLSLSQLFYGPLSDRIGRRKTAFLGLSISLLGSAMAVFCFNIASLILGRFVQGLGLGAGPTLARAIRRDVHSGNDLAHFGSYIIIGTSIMFALAPVVGGYIQHYMGWRENFLFMLIYTVLCMLSVGLWLPETHKKLDPLATKFQSLRHHYAVLLKSPIFMGYGLCSSLAFGGLTAYMTSSPFLFETIMGLTSIEYGRLGFVIALGLGLGGFYNQRAIKSLGRDHMLMNGIRLMFFSGLIMATLAFFGEVNTFAVMFPMLIYSGGAGVTFANSFAGAFHHFGRIAGFAAALYGCLQMLGGAVAAGLMALFHETTQIPLSCMLMGVGVLAYLLHRQAHRLSGHA